jgi:hypothetical protein
MSSQSLEQLHELIDRAMSGELPIKDFCAKFERVYNLELDKKSVPAQELPELEAIFNKVVWFSPFPEERAQIPNYLGESEIMAALSGFGRRFFSTPRGN